MNQVLIPHPEMVFSRNHFYYWYYVSPLVKSTEATTSLPAIKNIIQQRQIEWIGFIECIYRDELLKQLRMHDEFMKQFRMPKLPQRSPFSGIEFGKPAYFNLKENVQRARKYAKQFPDEVVQGIHQMNRDIENGASKQEIRHRYKWLLDFLKRNKHLIVVGSIVFIIMLLILQHFGKLKNTISAISDFLKLFKNKIVKPVSHGFPGAGDGNGDGDGGNNNADDKNSNNKPEIFELEAPRIVTPPRNILKPRKISNKNFEILPLSEKLRLTGPMEKPLLMPPVEKPLLMTPLEKLLLQAPIEKSRLEILIRLSLLKDSSILTEAYKKKEILSQEQVKRFLTKFYLKRILGEKGINKYLSQFYSRPSRIGRWYNKIKKIFSWY